MTNVYRYQVVPIIMVTVPNLWNVFVNLDMMDIFVLLLLVEMVAMQQQVHRDPVIFGVWAPQTYRKLRKRKL